MLIEVMSFFKKNYGVDLARNTGILLLIMVLILSLTSCSKEQAKPPAPDSEPDITEPEPEPEYTGQIAEAMDYLIHEGLKPIEVINDGTDMVITWEILCDDTNVQRLNAFLNDAISIISERKGYGEVNLKSIVILLEDKKTAAEIFFQEDKIIGGVTYPENDKSKQDKQYRSLNGETIEEIRNINYPIWETEQVDEPTLFQIQIESAFKDGFNEVNRIISFEQGRCLIVYRNDTESRVYVYDTQDGSDFYSGISLQDNSFIRAKQLQENKTALMLVDKILIVDSISFEVLDEIKYPIGERVQPDDIDISPDGKTIVYANKTGLVVCDDRFDNSNVIVESMIGADPHGMDSEVPRYPVFSPDSTQILYRMVGYEWAIGTGVIKVDGSDNRFFESDTDERVFTEWYDHNLLYSSSAAYSETEHPMLLNIDTGQKISLVKNIAQNKRLSYYPGNEGMLFYWETELSFEESENDTLIFGIYDINDLSSERILEIPMIHLDSSFYDKVNNTFVFTASNYPVRTKPFILAGID